MSDRPITPEETESATRLMDAVNLHVLAILAEKSERDRPPFVAIRLEDGRPADDKNPLYDSRADATRHNRHNPAVCFVKVGRETMSLHEATIYLQMNRMAYKRGVIFTEEDVITPHLSELMKPFIPRTLRGLNSPEYRNN